MQYKNGKSIRSDLCELVSIRRINRNIVKMRVNSEYASDILENIAKLKNETEKVMLIAGKDQQR